MALSFNPARKMMQIAAIGLGAAVSLAGAAPAKTVDVPLVQQMADLKIAATIPVGKTADWVAITPRAVWVGSTGPNAVSEIDPQTNRVTTVELPGRPCAGLATDGAFVWVPLCGTVPKLAKVAVATRSLEKVFDVGPAAPEGGIALGAGSVWLVTDKQGSLARIDPATGKVIGTVQLPAGSYNPVFSEGRVWISRFDGAELTVVDGRTAKVTGHVATGPHPRFLTAGGTAVWTLNQGDGTLSRIGTAAPYAVRNIALHIPGAGGDAAFGEGRVWTTLMETPLSVVDAQSGRLLCQWKGPGGDSLGVGHGAVWLTNLRAGTVSRIPLAGLPAACHATGAAR